MRTNDEVLHAEMALLKKIYEVKQQQSSPQLQPSIVKLCLSWIMLLKKNLHQWQHQEKGQHLVVSSLNIFGVNFLVQHSLLPKVLNCPYDDHDIARHGLGVSLSNDSVGWYGCTFCTSKPCILLAKLAPTQRKLARKDSSVNVPWK